MEPRVDQVLAELLATCPQYCGHCTRMDLVGNNTPTVTKLKLASKPADRHDAILCMSGWPHGSMSNMGGRPSIGLP